MSNLPVVAWVVNLAPAVLCHCAAREPAEVLKAVAERWQNGRPLVDQNPRRAEEWDWLAKEHPSGTVLGQISFEGDGSGIRFGRMVPGYDPDPRRYARHGPADHRQTDCPGASDGKHHLDDGKCLLCRLDLEYSR